MTTATVIKLPERSEVKTEDTWDLSKLFPDDDAWEAAFVEFEKVIDGYAQFKGTLGDGPDALVACLKFDSEADRAAERLGNYAFLKTAEDQTNSTYQRMMGRFQNVATRAGEAASFIRPEILAIPDDEMESFLADSKLELYQLMLERLARYKKYTLGEKEEQLLAMQGEMAGATSKIFRQLHDGDLKFGSVKNENGEEVEAVADEPEEEGSDQVLTDERFAEMQASEQMILTLSERGFGKRSSSHEYRVSGRGGKGIAAMAVNERNGELVSSFPVEETDEVMLVTDGGQLIRCPIKDIRVAGRSTQGVTVFKTSKDEKVVSVERITETDDDGKGEASAEVNEDNSLNSE